MKDNYQKLFNLYAQNAPAHKKLKQSIATIAVINKADPDEISCTVRLLKYAIFATQGRMKYYYRYYKADIRGKAVNLVKIMLEDWAYEAAPNPVKLLNVQQLGAYMPLLTCQWRNTDHMEMI